MFLKILVISVAHRKIDQSNISDHLKAPPPARQELIFSNSTNNSHGPLGVQFIKNCIKLKMFLMLLGTIRGAVQRLLHFGWKKSIYVPLGKCVKRAKKVSFLKGPNRGSKIFFLNFFKIGGFLGSIRVAVQSLLHFGWNKSIYEPPVKA